MSQAARWTCPRCQANNMPQQPSCFRCGSPPGPAPSDPTVYDPSATAPTMMDPRPRRGWPALGLAVLVAMVALGGAAAMKAALRPPPEVRLYWRQDAGTALRGEIENLTRRRFEHVTVRAVVSEPVYRSGLYLGTQDRELRPVDAERSLPPRMERQADGSVMYGSDAVSDIPPGERGGFALPTQYDRLKEVHLYERTPAGDHELRFTATVDPY